MEAALQCFRTFCTDTRQGGVNALACREAKSTSRGELLRAPEVLGVDLAALVLVEHAERLAQVTLVRLLLERLPIQDQERFEVQSASRCTRSERGAANLLSSLVSVYFPQCSNSERIGIRWYWYEGHVPPPPNTKICFSNLLLVPSQISIPPKAYVSATSILK